MKIYQLPGELRCPSCSGLLNMTSTDNKERQTPRPNDLSICAHCTIYLEYFEESPGRLGLHELSEDKFESLPEQHQISLMRLRAYHNQPLGGGGNERN